MQTVLLELNAGENVHVGHVPVHFFQLKFDMRFGHQLNLLDTEDSRSLAKFAKAAAPPRPEAKFQQPNWKRRRRKNANHSDQSLKTIDLLPNIFAQDRRLEIRKNDVRSHGISFTVLRVPGPGAGDDAQMADSPCSSVRIRIACSIATTKTFPSPILPVRAASTMVSTAF